VVQAALRGVADVHTRAFADVLQVAEMLEVLGRVGFAAARRELLLGFVTCLIFVGHAIAFGRWFFNHEDTKARSF
jgi:hypothetical protein